jgi:hypothetical protein
MNKGEGGRGKTRRANFRLKAELQTAKRPRAFDGLNADRDILYIREYIRRGGPIARKIFADFGLRVASRCLARSWGK